MASSCSSWLGLLLGLRSPFHMDQVEALIILAVNFVVMIIVGYR
jgi:hypothetical protein